MKPIGGDVKLDFNDNLKSLMHEYPNRRELYDELQKLYPDLSRNAIRIRVSRYGNSNTPMNDVEPIIDNKNIPVCEDYSQPITKSVETKADGSTIFERIICLRDSENITPQEVLIAHGMDPNRWEVISHKSNFYQQQKKGGQILNLYQSKITVKPTQDTISFEDIKKMFSELPSDYQPIRTKCKTGGKYLYEINIADLHLGRFASSIETGDFLNSAIAKQRFFEVIDKECERIMELGDDVEKILFVWSNDFFNSDGISSATTGGTPQDTDQKWQQLFLTGIKMLIEAIATLSQYAPVKTFYIASNHSRQVDFYAICSLYFRFMNDDNVEVDIEPSPRYYERYGVNLIGFAHSYYEKKANLPHLMQIERPKEWGETTYREYHLAHYHSEKVEEKGGIIFRWLPSITGADTWSTECGYIGAVRRSYSFVYDKEKGLVQMNSTIID